MHDQSSSLQDTHLSLAELRERKGFLSRSIGQAKKNQRDISQLLIQMQAVTQQIKAIEAAQTVQTSNKPENASTRLSKAPLPTRFSPSAQSASATEQQTSSAKITITPVQTEADIRQWQDFVTQSEFSSAYHQYCLRSVIEQTFGHNTNYLIAKDSSGSIVGVLPLVQLKSRLFGNYVVSMPFFNYGGVLANTGHIAQQLFLAAKQWADDIGATHTELRHVEKLSDQSLSAVKQDKVTMLLPLPAAETTLWQDIGAKVRAQIKKTEDYKPTYRIGQLELLDDFYQVFSRNMRDLGTPVYSRHWFANLLSALPEQSFITVAYINGKPAAAAFLIGWQDTLEIPWASSVRKFNYSNINMFMYWQVLREATKRGYAFFDFGRSSKDANTYRFKKQWGARPQQLYWHYQLPAGEKLPELNPNNPKYKLMIAVWQKLPLLLANVIGPHVVKNLP